MQQLGKLIQNAVKRGLPMLKDGGKISPKIKFSLKNPYILDAIPDNINLNSLEIFENKKLNTVCRILDDVDSDKIIARYKSFYKNHRNKDGLSHKCKSCITEQNKRYQLKELGKRGW